MKCFNGLVKHGTSELITVTEPEVAIVTVAPQKHRNREKTRKKKIKEELFFDFSDMTDEDGEDMTEEKGVEP